ncbi:hypothetical protein DFH08DRAFT_812242 [Mycena albidolilacea]|uniref:Uncharacterized protein n=1 Tax=Mycena albidolilacea TaxID=1033008 RepID=A0AAD7EME7_9AGAR|nr:hypothetical protein DFH08DRAFT_812242 [Mycena albidolilacea]
MVRVSIVQASSSTPTCPANKRNSLLAPQEASGPTLGDRRVDNVGGQLHWLQGMQFLILHTRLNGQWPALLLRRPSLECWFYDYIAGEPAPALNFKFLSILIQYVLLSLALFPFSCLTLSSTIHPPSTDNDMRGAGSVGHQAGRKRFANLDEFHWVSRCLAMKFMEKAAEKLW